jgi:glycosyltransferase involved in cell wall biosynthesis
MGHDVTTFGAEGSAEGVQAAADPSWIADLGGRSESSRRATYLARIYKWLGGKQFDVIHDHSGPFGVLLAWQSGLAPVVVHTIHGELREPDLTFYKEAQDIARLCAISHSQAQTAPNLKLAGIVHNAVEIPSTPPVSHRERYLVEVARITPDKGQHIAIEVARRTGRKLILAGKVERSGEGERYFEEEIEPYLGRTVEYYPNVHGVEKTRLIARAAAGIFPLQWSEPFGLAMAECMVHGTPVVALNSGSAPELIDNGVTGFVMNNIDELVAAVNRLDEIDPPRCAELAREKFSPRRMAEGYMRVYCTEPAPMAGAMRTTRVVSGSPRN